MSNSLSILQLTAIYPAKPCDDGRNDFLVCYAVSAQAGEQIYDKERQPTNYKNAWIISQPYRCHSIRKVFGESIKRLWQMRRKEKKKKVFHVLIIFCSTGSHSLKGIKQHAWKGISAVNNSRFIKRELSNEKQSSER